MDGWIDVDVTWAEAEAEARLEWLQSFSPHRSGLPGEAAGAAGALQPCPSHHRPAPNLAQPPAAA